MSYSDRTAKGTPAEIAELARKWAKEDAEWAGTTVPAAAADPKPKNEPADEPEADTAKAVKKKGT